MGRGKVLFMGGVAVDLTFPVMTGDPLFVVEDRYLRCCVDQLYLPTDIAIGNTVIVMIVM